MRGGGTHKDKKSKVEKKQVTRQEPLKSEGLVIQECDRDTVVQMIEESEENRKVMVRMLEEKEDNRKMIESMCEGSDVEVEQALQNYRTVGREVLGWDQGQVDLMERGLGWAVEARRKGRRQRDEERWQMRQEEQGRKSGQEEQSDVMSTDEQNAMSSLEEETTGRGRAGLVPRRGESRELNETKGKGKGKGNGGKGEHASKGGELGGKGFQQSVKTMKGEEEQDADEEDERGRVAPNMGAGGSHPQATSDPGKEEKEKKETRVLSWADCDDEEVKENEEEVEEEKETGQREMTDERPPGLEEVESEPKTQEEEKHGQVESEQEAQEENKESQVESEQEAHEEDKESQVESEQEAQEENKESQVESEQEAHEEDKEKGARANESAEGARGRAEKSAGGARRGGAEESA